MSDDSASKLQEHINLYFQEIIERSADLEFSSFLLGIRCKDYDEQQRRELKTSLGIKLYKLWADQGRDVNFKTPELLITCKGIEEGKAHVGIKRRGLHLYGRYNKLQREISQTRWVCQRCKGKGCKRCKQQGRRYEESVQELIAAHLNPPFGTHNLGFFHGMGREDCDVLMLGRGRPFTVEILNPSKRKLDLLALEALVNKALTGKVSINSLRYVDHKAPARIKGVTPDKSYRARCTWTGEVDLSVLQSLPAFFENRTLEQTTPQRVAHRRADMVRKRIIRSLSLENIDDSGCDVIMRTQSGTYVKEFISGDEQRTTPSFAEKLGLPCICSQLDVLDIHITDDDAIAGISPEPRPKN